MIQKVSSSNFGITFGQNKQEKKSPSFLKSEYGKEYADTFVKHAKESTPMLLGLTALWSAIDYGTRNISVQKSILQNLSGFFIPVLVASSALLTAIEMKKTSKSSNP